MIRAAMPYIAPWALLFIVALVHWHAVHVQQADREFYAAQVYAGGCIHAQ